MGLLSYYSWYFMPEQVATLKLILAFNKSKKNLKQMLITLSGLPLYLETLKKHGNWQFRKKKTLKNL